MKTLLVAMTVLVSANMAFAKQDTSVNPRVVSQENGLTAGDQSNKPEDVLVTRKIRSELVHDDGLSNKAKNVKIIVLNNGVTLKGEVETAAEREKILKHAYLTAPEHKIYNQISVVR